MTSHTLLFGYAIDRKKLSSNKSMFSWNNPTNSNNDATCHKYIIQYHTAAPMTII